MVVGEVAVEVDVVVIGGGPGGYTAAIRLGQLGKSVVLVEKSQLGGVCLNRGCIPSKALIHAANQYYHVADINRMGIRLPKGEAAFDLPVWQEWKQSIVSQLNRGVSHLCTQNGVTVVKGEAVFLSEHRLGVETDHGFEVYKFQEAVIATGSSPLIPSFANVEGTHVLDSTAALEMQELPESIAIIGGGYIGIELGMAFAKLGSRVTVVEMADMILPQVSACLTREVVKKAKQLGIEIRTRTKVEKVAIERERVKLDVSSEIAGSETLISEKVLITIGRLPNTRGIGLDEIGVNVDERGYICIDAECRTNLSHIYAIGDITPGPALAHRAAKQGVVAAEVIAGLPSAVDSTFVPYVIFSDPQIAGVGITAEEAERRGRNVSIGQFPYRANGGALAMNKTEGFAQVIVDKDSHLLLGMHVVGADASNLIGEGVLALELGARVEDIALTIHPHPTLTEVWLEAAEAAVGRAIHIVNK